MGSMKTPVELAVSGMQTLHLQPRCRGGCRVKARPSYVDETLFGNPAGTRPTPPDFDPPWVEKANRTRGAGTGLSQASGANPSSTPRGSHSPRPRETPVRAIHPAGPSETGPRVAADSRKLSRDGLDPPHPLRRERSHSLTHLKVPSTGRPPTSAPRANGPRNPRPSPSGVTFQSPLVTPRAQSVSVSVPATPRQGGATQKPKPPWK
ncbi:hypothetical protein HPG69_019296 [Diceros bicornis minor]|uniref:RBPJ-interacting and tubulin-associated protein 1 n=1 Tax=Diceros bicornis minor TaxID=77932 RepID=A0A7J7FMJ0_DICBM|nr:hypothetical protein HPG69_019296 [Diceros bicornis minor]